MNESLEQMYRTHHANKRGEDFALLGADRGSFLKRHIGKGKRVLDIGCRDGALTSHYAEDNEVLGVDIDSEALVRAKEKLGIEVVQKDLHAPWDLAPKSYDAVVACEVLEHLYYPEQVLEKITGVLKGDGMLIGSVPNAFSLAHRARYLRAQKRHTPLADPTHINHFTVRELEALLSAHFEESKVVGLGRLGWLARTFPQQFAFDLLFVARRPRYGTGV